ncbi:hypothetical protein [Halomonas cerina]|uniref:Glycosyltransferase n=1 Tax=Halomonas cerina TaxID=447424 RepID=A0A839V452_9GAMM|nr:hypothetical protein [Halomonas cerina]MBB3188790.1 hypothetical protein [Halomonas cerina]
MLKALAKKIPGAHRGYDAVVVVRRNLANELKVWKLLQHQRQPFIGNPDSNVVVSLTSFPARIHHAWITVETLFQQEFKPWKVVLVLAEEEFPEKKLPKRLRAQTERGLEVLWTKRNTRSYKKLLPTRNHYPDATIVTFDDDVYYEPWRLGQLVEASRRYPESVIGHRGREVTLGRTGLLPYIEWKYATLSTPSHRTLLTGVGGILYPPHILDHDLLLDRKRAMRYCPTADDIWFWAVCLKSGTSVRCLGHSARCQVKKELARHSLDAVNRVGGQNDVQLKNVIDGLQLWPTVMRGECQARPMESARLPTSLYQ